MCYKAPEQYTVV